jgi:transcriptional regulator with XRE-family HTH domain
VKVIAYRAEHELSQTALAKRLKMSQPAVARLERGEHSPTFPMLLSISDALGVELAIDITPSGHEPQRLSGVPSRGSGGSFARTSAATRGRGPARGARSAQCDLAPGGGPCLALNRTLRPCDRNDDERQRANRAQARSAVLRKAWRAHARRGGGTAVVICRKPTPAGEGTAAGSKPPAIARSRRVVLKRRARSSLAA